MSYKNVVLSDSPMAFYTLDNLSLGGEVPDLSGCNNTGSYTGNLDADTVPIVLGSSYTTTISDLFKINYPINNSFYNASSVNSVGVKDNSFTKFSIELWFAPFIESTSEVSLVGDLSNSIGVFYENGNINFKIGSDVISYTLINKNRVSHVVAVYAINYMYLYINGMLVVTKQTSPSKIANESLDLQSGYTEELDSFYISNVAIYSYDLPANKVMNHFKYNLVDNAKEVVFPDNGELFQVFDNSPSYAFKYSYPGNKPWTGFTSSELAYNEKEESLYLIPTSTPESKVVTIQDFFSIPISYPINSGKIEWESTEGISVSVSKNGTDYEQVLNNHYFLLEDEGEIARQIYVQITMSTSDSTKFIPRIKSLIIKFYNDFVLPSSNGSSLVSSSQGVGYPSNDISVSSKYDTPLSLNPYNGVRVNTDNGMFINTDKNITSIEFFYTPETTLSGALVEAQAVDGTGSVLFRWGTNGNVSKANVAFIRVNGVDVTSNTNISSILKPKKLHHIFIKFVDPVSGSIRLNKSISGSPDALIQNIAIYEADLSSATALKHYQIYTAGESRMVSDSEELSIQMTENSANYYSNDWNVVSSS